MKKTSKSKASKAKFRQPATKVAKAQKPVKKQAKKPAKKKPAKPAKSVPGLTYAQSGVDIHAGDAVVDLIKPACKATLGPRCMGAFGGFAGMFRLDQIEGLKNWKKPVLVACTDGVGTKVLLAIEMGKLDTVGQDCVAMNVNDMIVQGAQPVVFLDYVGVGKVTPRETATIIGGVAKACEIAGCALLGGETAEMPAVYKPGEFDLAGFAVGVVELDRVLDAETSKVKAGDVILGLKSSGVHSNGFSLVRAILKKAKLKLEKRYPELDRAHTLGEVLLEPTRIYVRSILAMLDKFPDAVTGMSHITGSGIPGNLPRCLPNGLDAVVEKGSWSMPPIFPFLQRYGRVAEAEMYDVFNMGLGYCVVVRPEAADAVAAFLEQQGETVSFVGTIVPGKAADAEPMVRFA